MNRGIPLLALSLVLGAAAVAGMSRLNKPQTAENLPSIVVAKTSLKFGQHIRPLDVQLVRWPAQTMPAGAFTKIEDIAGPGQDRVALREIEANEPVLPSKITGTGGKASLSTIIDPTMRDVTIRVNDATGVAGFITPGDRVDIMLTRDDGGNKESAKTDLLLQNVLVRGIDQEANEHKEKPTVVKAVTVEVSPTDAQKLTLAGNIGVLSLSLRNVTTADEVRPSQLSVKDLAPTPARPEVVVETPIVHAAPSHQIEILRGTNSTIYEVKRNGTIAVSGRVPEQRPTPAPAASSDRKRPQLAAD
jgi:pilus assembly protein CpaB